VRGQHGTPDRVEAFCFVPPAQKKSGPGLTPARFFVYILALYTMDKKTIIVAPSGRPSCVDIMAMLGHRRWSLTAHLIMTDIANGRELMGIVYINRLTRDIEFAIHRRVQTSYRVRYIDYNTVTVGQSGPYSIYAIYRNNHD